MEQVGKGIAEHVQWLQDGLPGIPGVRLHSPWNPSRYADILTFGLDGQGNRVLFETLRQERVICAQHGGGIRFSPYFYTSSTVIDDTLAILHQVAGTQMFKDDEGIPNPFKKPPALSGRPASVTSTRRY